MLICNTNWRCCCEKGYLGVDRGCSGSFGMPGVLRLTVPLLYAFLVPTIFHKWYYAHQALADGIWYGMLVALSWIVTIVRRIRDLL